MNTDVKKPKITKEAKQRRLDKLQGDPKALRRPLHGYEGWYEVTSDGALYSVTLDRFLKPAFNSERKSPELHFEHQGQEIKMSPGKAVALSFFSYAQRKRISDEAYGIKPYKSSVELKGHPAIDKLAKKYGVDSSAIFYLMLVSIPKPSLDTDK